MTMLLAKKFNVPEVEIVRALPENRAVELDVARWEERRCNVLFQGRMIDELPSSWRCWLGGAGRLVQFF